MASNTHDIHKALVGRCRNGDNKAQHELYRLYSKAMYNICMRMLNHVGEAEDALQEAFLQAFRKLGSLRSDETFGPWLKRIVVNRCVNTLKKRKLYLVDELPDTEHETQSEEEDYSYEIKLIHEAIQQLPDGYRIVLTLYLLEGYDHTEISEILGITEGTSKSQYNRAKEKLKTLLKSRNYAGQA